MLLRLKQMVAEVAPLHSKLILLIGPPGCGKTALLASLGEHTRVSVMNLGLELGARLSKLPNKQRRLQAGNLLRELADAHTSGYLLLVDNVELLFDASLAINPLDLLKRLAHARRIVAAWPGEHREGSTGAARLTYAETNHPEHRDYPLMVSSPFTSKPKAQHQRKARNACATEISSSSSRSSRSSSCSTPIARTRARSSSRLT